jgi:hypothetical protein
MKIIRYAAAVATGLTLLASCSDDYLDTEYTRYLDKEKAGEIAAADPDALNGYLNGIWAYMVAYSDDSHDCFGFTSIYHACDMMTDDITMYAFHWFGYDYDFDNRDQTYRRVRVNWSHLYTLISKANEIISFFPETPEGEDSKGLLGQGYAMRGFSYLYLIQLFQFPTASDGSLNLTAPGVPLIYNDTDGLSEEEQARRKGRNTVGDVLAQAESDLIRAVELLEAGYARPNKMFIDAGVANGLLARYYLLTQQWQKAADAAAKARERYPVMSPSALFDGFMDLGNAEWMWGFDHTTETQTTYASFFSHISDLTPGYSGIMYSGRGIDKRLYDLIPETDYRKGLFNGPEGDASQSSAGARQPYAVLKFGWDGNWTMDYLYMRSSEMVLIEAEAYARLGNTERAGSVLDELMRKRDVEWEQTSVELEDILLQRRIELFGEGFGYFDLKRLNRGINRNYEESNHLTGYKLEIPAGDKRWAYQIPITEIQENTAISEGEQND